MFISFLGIQISILGLTAVLIGLASMIILIWKQKMTWYIWSMWIACGITWFCHFIVFQDVASLIDTSISLILSILGLISLLQKKKRKKTKKK